MFLNISPFSIIITTNILKINMTFRIQLLIFNLISKITKVGNNIMAEKWYGNMKQIKVGRDTLSRQKAHHTCIHELRYVHIREKMMQSRV